VLKKHRAAVLTAETPGETLKCLANAYSAFAEREEKPSMLNGLRPAA
jgi:hypothetical protein